MILVTIRQSWRMVGTFGATELLLILIFQWAGYAGETILTLALGLAFTFVWYMVCWKGQSSPRWDQWRLLAPRWLALLCARRSTQLVAPLTMLQIGLLSGGGGFVYALAIHDELLTLTFTGFSMGVITGAAVWTLWFLWRFVR